MNQKPFNPLIRALHHVDYAWLLPLLAQMPLSVGYRMAQLRGNLNGWLGRDWRSMALGTRHIARQSLAGFRTLCPNATEAELRLLVKERFRAEGVEEFEGQLIAAKRVAELKWVVEPGRFLEACRQRKSGLLLLTPHFDSFWLGTVFLARSGFVVNGMTSAVTNDAMVAPAVQRHFFTKYRGIEHYLNGGRMLNMEDGLRPFYQMLERGECLVILADAPAVAGGVIATPQFLGSRREMAGGALRLASKTGSSIGGFVCRYCSYGQYLLKGGPVMDVANPDTMDLIYDFLSREIKSAPGRWVAADLLPLMLTFDEGGDS